MLVLVRGIALEAAVAPSLAWPRVRIQVETSC